MKNKQCILMDAVESLNILRRENMGAYAESGKIFHLINY
jgi:hypothetical protein